MTEANFLDLVNKRITFYGVTIKCFLDKDNGWYHIIFRQNVPDSETHILIKLGQDIKIDEYMVHNMDEKQCIRYIRKFIIDLCIHEIDEFFEVDGIKVFNPHN